MTDINFVYPKSHQPGKSGPLSSSRRQCHCSLGIFTTLVALTLDSPSYRFCGRVNATAHLTTPPARCFTSLPDLGLPSIAHLCTPSIWLINGI
ncbi:MAG: hypothetical protein ACU4EQ_13300 [Candidatus Nitrosoglobus sp.]